MQSYQINVSKGRDTTSACGAALAVALALRFSKLYGGAASISEASYREEKLVPTTAGRRLIDAFLAGDASSAVAMLALDATFHSPIRDYAGADRIASVWRAVAGVVADARPTSLHERDGETIAFFAGAIKDQHVDGVLRTLTDDDDRVTDITLMVRPWAALKAGIVDIKI